MKTPPLEAWGLCSDLQPLNGGCRNDVFRTVGLTEDVVFKSTRRSTDAIQWLLPVQDLARRSGFVVPNLQRSLNGRWIECGWTCETLVSGRAVQPDELPGIAPLINKFHTQTRHIQQRPTFLASYDLIASTRGGDVDLSLMPSNLVRSCREAWRDISGLSRSVVHGDLNTGNLLRTDRGEIAVLDWDESRFDVSIFDTGAVSALASQEIRLAMLAWETACSWTLEPQYAKACAEKLGNCQPPKLNWRAPPIRPLS